MADLKKTSQKLEEGLTPAREGYGPLLQRDYWAVIRSCRLSCSEVALLVRRRFRDFPPDKLVRFAHPEDDRALEVGDELEVNIRMSGKTSVRVVHVNSNSLTLCTAKGHPEAGRITFGAYRNERGDVIFHIRSRARSSTMTRYAGFLTAGDPMQTTTWTDFIDRLAHTVGDGVIGAIRADVKRIGDEHDDPRVDTPTYIAEGD